MTRARVHGPSGTPRPEELVEVTLHDVRIGSSDIALPGVHVADTGPERLFTSDDLRFDPRDGGGPFCPPEQRLEARAFGVVNVGFHLRRGLVRIAALLGRGLPPLAVRIGVHDPRAPRWGGGHYRLPALTYTSMPEAAPPAATGEIHLGRGGRFVLVDGRPYFNAPAHNAAIVYHELGHHLTRHTADFRVNVDRPAGAQANRKIALDEGTSDYVAGMLLETADIFGWHRHHEPATSLRRRRLDGPWTMAAYGGARSDDPHSDGTIWASALWASRIEVQREGVAAEEFDRLVLRALVRIGRSGGDLPRQDEMERRRQFGHALQALLDEDRSAGGRAGTVVERVFAGRGIVTGYDNDELRERWRARLPLAAGCGR
jgi:hypothetical protein